MVCCKLADFCNKNGVGTCSVKASCLQFAAIDSHIAYKELPAFRKSDFNASSSELTSCVNNNFSLCATVIALIGTYSNAGNIVLFASKTTLLDNTLRILSEYRLKMSAGITVLVSPADSNNGSFEISVYEKSLCITVTENKMLSFVNSLTKSAMSMVLYLYPGSVGYASFLQLSERSIWVSSVSERLNMTGTKGVKFIPMFYCKPTIENLLSINTGDAVIDIGSNVSEMQPLIDSMVSSAISAGTKDGKCYFCSYITNIHASLCDQYKHEIFTEPLIGKFAELLE